MDLRWRTDLATLLPTEDVYHVEQAASSYFSGLLAEQTHSAFQEPNEVLNTAVSVRNQTIGNEVVVFDSLVEVIHIGDQGIFDLAALLMFLTNKNTTNSSFTTLDSLIGMGVHLDMVSFTNAEGSEVLNVVESSAEDASSKYTESEQTLIIVTAALSLALFAMSVILIWVAGGWLALRKQVKVLIHREEELTRMTKQREQDLEMLPTASEETDEEGGANEDDTQFTNPSGILGVNPYYGRSGNGGSALDGLGIKMTPARGANSDTGSEIFTPMSEATHYSDSGRMPIGITSMRKLIPDGEGEQDDINDSLRSSFGMKRLQY
jgi:hypothetical protein